MATVTSLTATRIQELLAGWESVGLSQDEINSLVIQLGATVEGMGAVLENFNEVTLPQMEAEVSSSANAISELNDNLLPTLDADLAQAKLDVQEILEVRIPSLQTDMENTLTNAAERPNIYVQDEPPENPDDDGRDLVVGDTWFDSNDDNVQRIWNGTEWSSLTVEVADFSLTAQKFKTSTHMLY